MVLELFEHFIPSFLTHLVIRNLMQHAHLAQFPHICCKLAQLLRRLCAWVALSIMKLIGSLTLLPILICSCSRWRHFSARDCQGKFIHQDSNPGRSGESQKSQTIADLEQSSLSWTCYLRGEARGSQPRWRRQGADKLRAPIPASVV